MTFDEALTSLLGLIGQDLEISVFDAAETPHLVASFGGRLKGAHPMSAGEPSDDEALFLQLDSGSHVSALSLDRELSRGANVSRMAD